MMISPRLGLRPLLAAFFLLLLTALLSACQGGGDSASTAPVVADAVKPGYVRVYLWRKDNVYNGWGVYAFFGPKTPSTGWPGTPRFLFDKPSSFGAYADVEIDPAQGHMDFLINQPTADGKDAIKNCGSDMRVAFTADIASKGQQVWVKDGDCTVYASEPVRSNANLVTAKAYWLSADTLVWPGALASASYKLYASSVAGMSVGTSGIIGSQSAVDLSVDTSGLSAPLKARFPYLANATVLRLPAAANAKQLLTGQLALAQIANGALLDATQLQIAGVLDDLYAKPAANVALGSRIEGGRPVFRLWAPTAQAVSLLLFDGAASSSPPTSQAMTLDVASGVWTASGDASWINSRYYAYQVQVYAPSTGKVESNQVTDPYSLGLAANSTRSLITDLTADSTKPANWDGHAIPPLADNHDISLYELHIRDFSANDASVAAADRGKYLAFANPNSNGMRHLTALAQSGLTHVHLLPSNDMSSVPELAADQKVPNIDTTAAGDSESQQAAVQAVRDSDAFNWGYDPLHYTTPEGSYASDPNGTVRNLEFRQMVLGLHRAGLRVVMDVVYNHTPAGGQNSKSILDRVVPGYYHRLDGNGAITNSTCCANTATENAMMAKLMIDSVSTWAAQYKIDAFRFDLMGHQPLAVMQNLQAAVNAAAGRPIYLYGEGWNFGEVADDQRFVQATQKNLAGSGIGSFSDRLRDAVRGGGPFDGASDIVKNQGFINGGCYDANASGACNADKANAALHAQDLIRLGLAGNLKDYTLVDYTGASKKGSQFDYNGAPAGYTADPLENIVYISAHDNQTLFDINQYKLPLATTTADRARAQILGMSLVALAQGIPFFHAGDDLLRSKSMDRDSYNSGDWFNRIDWTYQSNNWAVGLPLKDVNGDNYAVIKPLLGNAALKPTPTDIAWTRDIFRDFLKIRASTPLFRLRSAAEVTSRVSFPDAGKAQRQGVIAMRIDGRGYAGAVYQSIVVVFNADKTARGVTLADFAGHRLSLHPVQAAGSDSVVRAATFSAGDGSFSVPARSTAVFVEN